VDRGNPLQQTPIPSPSPRYTRLYKFLGASLFTHITRAKAAHTTENTTVIHVRQGGEKEVATAVPSCWLNESRGREKWPVVPSLGGGVHRISMSEFRSCTAGALTVTRDGTREQRHHRHQPR
jgi:hypothetical protein